MLMIAADYRESLRAYKPRVFVNGQRVESVADEPLPGINAVSVTCDFAHRAEHVAITTARQGTSGKTVSRMLHINENSTDLLYKLEAVRLVCKVSGCADAMFSNIGKLLLATKTYDMHKIAHYVSGGLIVALPGPDEDHNPETKASLTAVLGGRSDIPVAQRMDVARFIEDLTVSNQGGWYSVISMHGGGSP